jgi:hypothetical protein
VLWPGLLDGSARSRQQDALIAGLIAQTPSAAWGFRRRQLQWRFFLASDDNSFMTGSEAFVGGGMAQV